MPTIVSPPPKPPQTHISYSSLSLFKICPLRYFFRYLAGLPEETVASSLALGSGIHAGIQLHFEKLLAGSPAPDLDTLLDVFWESWHTHDHQKILFNTRENVNTVGELAERIFKSFQQSPSAHPEGTILGVEEELRDQLVPGLPDLLARLDLIVETEDALVVTDFKTSRSAWNIDQISDSSSQLLLYGELVRPLAGNKPVRLEFAVLTKTKTPSVNVYPVPQDQKTAKRTKVVTQQIWRTIQAGHFYPNPSPMNCSTCPFKKPCQAWPD